MPMSAIYTGTAVGLALAALTGVAVIMYRGQRALRITGAATATAFMLAGVAVAAVSYRESYFVGFNGSRVAVFRGFRWFSETAVTTKITRDQVPVGFRHQLEAGIPVDDRGDGLRLAAQTPHVFELPDPADGYDTGTSMIKAPACIAVSGRHVWREGCGYHDAFELYAVVATPYHRHPGQRLVEQYGEHMCDKRARKLLGSDPHSYRRPVWPTGQAWADGNRRIGCFVKDDTGRLLRRTR